MGDRAWVGITIYDCPEDQQEVVADFMFQYGFISNPDDPIVFGEQYEYDEMGLGFCSSDVLNLIRTWPTCGLVIDAAQGNRYEYAGEQLWHTPELGTFLGDADGLGNVYITAEDLDTVLNKARAENPGATALDFKVALDAHLGVPWESHFAKLHLAHKTNNEERSFSRPKGE